MSTEANVSLREAMLEDVPFLVSAHMAVNAEKFEGKDSEAKQFESNVTKWAKQEVTGEVKHSITYLIEVDGVSAGRFRLVRRDYELMVAGIQMLPAYQNRGIGSGLIKSAILEAGERKVPCRLVVGKENPNAKRLYSRLGFKVIKDMDDDEMMEIPVEDGS
jgi:ribosomal protein S18 acetylase RimI-like enzyme